MGYQRGPLVVTMDEAPGPSGPELLLALDRASARPLHEQLETHAPRPRPQRPPRPRREGALLAGARGGARDLPRGGARGVLAADRRGLSGLASRARRRASRHDAERRAPAGARGRRSSAGYRYRFDPGLPDLAAFPRDQWVRSLRAALRDAPFAALGHGDPRGAPELRNELMAYLGRVSRAPRRSPSTRSYARASTAGLRGRCAARCAARGVERVAVEEPGWNRAPG